jgi:LysR substrate binding domain
VNLIDEGIEAALRIAHLPDSSMIAVRVGDVRRVIAAAPSYLAKHPRIDEPGDLAKHQIIAMNHFGVDSWSFPPTDGLTIPRTVHFAPHRQQCARRGRLGRRRARCDAGVLTPEGRLSVPKVRAFVDFAVPRLRAQFARLAADAGA